MARFALLLVLAAAAAPLARGLSPLKDTKDRMQEAQAFSGKDLALIEALSAANRRHGHVLDVLKDAYYRLGHALTVGAKATQEAWAGDATGARSNQTVAFVNRMNTILNVNQKANASAAVSASSKKAAKMAKKAEQTPVLFEPLMQADFVLDANNYLEDYINASGIVKDTGIKEGATPTEIKKALASASGKSR
mmetsp:Transcript_66367/g.205505  ORF Transcript_66367/g.205505 Transcript_66367/m.205505 type:complete len:193 (-) Transcript_66367:53-631(-)